MHVLLTEDRTIQVRSRTAERVRQLRVCTAAPLPIADWLGSSLWRSRLACLVLQLYVLWLCLRLLRPTYGPRVRVHAQNDREFTELVPHTIIMPCRRAIFVLLVATSEATSSVRRCVLPLRGVVPFPFAPAYAVGVTTDSLPVEDDVGLVWHNGDRFAEVGAVASCRQSTDCSSVIHCRAFERVRFVDAESAASNVYATCQPLVDTPASAADAAEAARLHTALWQALCDLAELKDGSVPAHLGGLQPGADDSDPGAFSFALAGSVADLELADAQRLLEMTSCVERLRLLEDILQEKLSLARTQKALGGLRFG